MQNVCTCPNLRTPHHLPAPPPPPSISTCPQLTSHELTGASPPGRAAPLPLAGPVGGPPGSEGDRRVQGRDNVPDGLREAGRRGDWARAGRNEDAKGGGKRRSARLALPVRAAPSLCRRRRRTRPKSRQEPRGSAMAGLARWRRPRRRALRAMSIDSIQRDRCAAGDGPHRFGRCPATQGRSAAQVLRPMGGASLGPAPPSPGCSTSGARCAATRLPCPPLPRSVAKGRGSRRPCEPQQPFDLPWPAPGRDFIGAVV